MCGLKGLVLSTFASARASSAIVRAESSAVGPFMDLSERFEMSVSRGTAKVPRVRVAKMVKKPDRCMMVVLESMVAQIDRLPKEIEYRVMVGKSVVKTGERRPKSGKLGRQFCLSPGQCRNTVKLAHRLSCFTCLS